MATLSARQVFQPSCPQGGDWAACNFGSRFVGCCLEASAACVDGCSQENLKPASFLKERYLDIPGSTCPKGSEWYTCASTTPTFLGCCTSNPCTQNGCPSKDLRAANLSMSEAEAGLYSAIPDPAATQTPSTSLSPSSTSSTTLLAGSSAISELSPSSTSHTSIGAVAGGIVGGIAVIALLAALALFLIRRRRRQRHSSTAIAPPDSDKETPASSFQGSSTFPTPFHELETPPPDPWHIPTGKVHELPSPGLGGRQRSVDDEKQVAEMSKNGLGIYTPYKPTGKVGTGTHGLYDEGRNMSYELDGREIDRGSKARI